MRTPRLPSTDVSIRSRCTRAVIASEASAKIALLSEVDPARANAAEASSAAASVAIAFLAAVMTSIVARTTGVLEDESTRDAADENAAQSAATHAATSHRASQSSTTCGGIFASRSIAAFNASRLSITGCPSAEDEPPAVFFAPLPFLPASSAPGPHASSSAAWVQNLAASLCVASHRDQATSSVSSSAPALTSSTMARALAPNLVATHTPSHALTTPRTASRVHSFKSRLSRNTSSDPPRTHTFNAPASAYGIHSSWHDAISVCTAAAVGVRRFEPAHVAHTCTSDRASAIAAGSETPAGGGSPTLASCTTRCSAAPAADVALAFPAATSAPTTPASVPSTPSSSSSPSPIARIARTTSRIGGASSPRYGFSWKLYSSSRSWQISRMACACTYTESSAPAMDASPKPASFDPPECPPFLFFVSPDRDESNQSRSRPLISAQNSSSATRAPSSSDLPASAGSPRKTVAMTAPSAAHLAPCPRPFAPLPHSHEPSATDMAPCAHAHISEIIPLSIRSHSP